MDVKYYLAFYRPKSKLMFLAWVIMWVEDRDSSHCEILRVENGDIEYAKSYGSIFPKSKMRSWQRMKQVYHCTKVIPIVVSNKENADKLLGSMVGKYYSLVQILFTGLKILFGSTFKCLGRVRLNMSKFLICTELCGVFMRDAGDYNILCSPDVLELDEIEDLALARLVG